MKNDFFRAGSVLAAGLFAALAPAALAQSTVVTSTETAGTISEFSPNALVIRSEVQNAPTRYVVSKEVSYVDDAGAPVAVEVVKSGAPVTVHYVREGDQVVARRVIVHRKVTAVPAPTTVVVPAPAPVIEQRTTTTTTTTTEK